jgi:hypothetical protein
MLRDIVQNALNLSTRVFSKRIVFSAELNCDCLGVIACHVLNLSIDRVNYALAMSCASMASIAAITIAKPKHIDAAKTVTIAIPQPMKGIAIQIVKAESAMIAILNMTFSLGLFLWPIYRPG